MCVCLCLHSHVIPLVHLTHWILKYQQQGRQWEGAEKKWRWEDFILNCNTSKVKEQLTPDAYNRNLVKETTESHNLTSKLKWE